MTVKRIPYARQDITEEDISAVCRVLRADFLTQGPEIECFERTVAAAVKAEYAVAVSSATAGLHLACLALGLGAGDILWTSPNTFVASANCAFYCGASVDFVDICPATFNISVPALAEKLEKAEREGKLPKIIVVVHMAGQPCAMREISEIARRYGCAIIEDAAHALGAEYENNPVGHGQYSDVTVFSFHPVKIITTGEGGMVVTNRADLAQSLARLRTHGITRDPALMENPSHGPWYYEQIDLGYHYRMTDIQAALGTSQFGRLDQFIARRRALAAQYRELLANLPVTTQQPNPAGLSSHHLFVIRLQLADIRRSHREVFEAMRDAGILVNLHYIPVHLQPYFRRLGFAPGDFPEAEKYYGEAISLPLFYGLENEEQIHVVETLRQVLA